MLEEKHRRRIGPMWSWLLIGVLFVLGMGLFHWLGGIGAAARAIRRWGRSSV
jgi:hypothetical protein